MEVVKSCGILLLGLKVKLRVYLLIFGLTTASPMSQTKGFVGYTVTSNDTVNVTGGTGGSVKAIEGKFIFPGDSASIKVSGGPGFPNGKYVLDVNIVPAFEDLSGTMYFKKTIVNATV